ncbi:DUF881 domain-containing protein [Tessaracoccus sp. OH4464_COT-324]|uniref:DUF881 domain-containing protein n=1 Tax=Tessaracoccus sp. OH4464_COT-324 TaxID=2491059 RepID=UPI00131A478D|nr:DUF881 domain-containing protein [Tessaracoccus sp. OH4464_COT-324]
MPEQPDEVTAGAAAEPGPRPDGAASRPLRRGLERDYVRDFLRPSRGQVVAAVLLCVTALLLTWSWRSQSAQPEFAQARQADLVQLLDTVTSRSRGMEAELRDLEQTYNELLSGQDQEAKRQQDAQRRLEQLSILAGLVPAEGPGIVIRIEDPQGKMAPDLMLNAVEELRDAGAEVIELNGKVRLVAGSYFTSDQGRLLVDEVPLDAPYMIRAIGDPATLEAGARFRGGLVSEVEGARMGGQVFITQQELIRIQSINDPGEYQFARPR